MKKKKQEIKTGENFIISNDSDQATFMACEMMADARTAINYFSSKLRIAEMRLESALKKAYPGVEGYNITIDPVDVGRHIVRIGKKIET